MTKAHHTHTSSAAEQTQTCGLEEDWKTQRFACSFAWCLDKGDHGWLDTRRDGKACEKYEALLEFLSKESRLTWAEIEKLDRVHGGFEEIPVHELKANLLEHLPDSLAAPGKLMSFYFGGYKYRILGMPNTECRQIFEVLGFDWDFSLYNHGS